MDALEKCHSQLAKILGPGAEPIEVLRCAEEHRAFWRPQRVRVILLAESHVYTTTSELSRRITLKNAIPNGVPCGFVRLVYCVGYGENAALDRAIVGKPKNSGTPQFWKIFCACVNRVNTNDDFASIQISRNRSFENRIKSKLDLLQRLKEMGVWLLDASLAALYFPGRPKPTRDLVENCLCTSWDEYVGQVVRTASPSHIVCVGKGVNKSLGDRLASLGVPMTIVSQPNARLTSAEHFDAFKTYYEVVQHAQGVLLAHTPSLLQRSVSICGST